MENVFGNCWDWQNHIVPIKLQTDSRQDLGQPWFYMRNPWAAQGHRAASVAESTGNPKKESIVTQSCLTLCDPWTIAHQDPLSMEFSWQEYWCGLPFPFPDLPNLGIKPSSPALQDSLPAEPPGKPLWLIINNLISCSFIQVYPMTLMVLLRHLLNSLGIISIFWKNTLELQEAEPCGLWMQISWYSNQICRYIQIPHRLTGWVSLPIF